jgi:hypothetical protein
MIEIDGTFDNMSNKLLIRLSKSKLSLDEYQLLIDVDNLNLSNKWLDGKLDFLDKKFINESTLEFINKNNLFDFY